MPKLGQYAPILKTVFFLYESEEAARAGLDSGGTGFLVAVPSKRWGARFVHVHGITNWHVAVFNEDGPPYPVIRLNRQGGGDPITLLSDPSEWIFQPQSYDVAVSPPLAIPEGHDAKWLDGGFLMTAEEEAKHEIGAADDVFMVGRFVDYEGVETTTPAVRFGHVSILSAQIEQHSGYMGRSIVVDMHSRSGFSGSPVFVFRTIGSHFMEGKPNSVLTAGGGHLMALLGMHWGQFPEEWELKNKPKNKAKKQSALITEGQYVEGLSGMTCVIPSACISEVLKLPELEAMREQIELEIASGPNAHLLAAAPKAE